MFIAIVMTLNIVTHFSLVQTYVATNLQSGNLSINILSVIELLRAQSRF